jgi:eukaryotic-like serine/threonine-protein kinase
MQAHGRRDTLDFVQTEHTQVSGGTARTRAPADSYGVDASLDGQRLSSVLTSSTTALAQRSRIEREEVMSDVLRLRWLSLIGLSAWMAFLLQDWMVVHFGHEGHLSYFLIIRGAGVIPIAYVALRLRSSRPMTRRTLTLLDVGVFCIVQSGITLMCLRHGGIASTYITGVMVAMIARGSVLAAPWQRGILLIGGPASMFPLVLGVSALFLPGIRQQFSESAALATFVEHLFVLSFATGISVWGGHGAWALRRQLFETRSIGKYRLKHCTGRGGMGEVWVAYHPGLQRDVALKILRPDQDTDPIAVQRFEQEVAATTRLTHPNTVRVFDYGVTEDGIWYYAMELLEGQTLADLVRAEGRLSIDRALGIAHQVARALAEAHARGIFHRDVKPENVFITRAGDEPDFAKVLDFGIAKVSQETASATLTRTGAIFGTPAYLSPEAARGKVTDARSDVYSLGAVLYFMLAGEAPFQAANSTELLLAHVHQPAPSLRDRPEFGVPETVDALVLRCLEKEPDRRFADAAELGHAIAECRKRREAAA